MGDFKVAEDNLKAYLHECKAPKVKKFLCKKLQDFA